VTSPQIGQRVAVPWLGYACGTCRYCLTGWETLCLSQQNTGYSVDGGYAEYFLAEAAFAAPVPDGIDPREVAPLTCAGVTTYKAIKVGNVGSIVGTRADLNEVFGLHAAGRTKVL
jgi:propanol-preferring alcohol dehydrogenase